jgi:F-type H+-transporting ATPase subunit epsilon
MKTFNLEIITPEKVAYKNEVEQLSIPAYDGEMGILPGHIDYLAMLNPGEIRIKPANRTAGGKGNDMELFAVSGGFAEIHPKNVVILCETAESADEIDVERAELSKMRAKEKLKTRGEGIDELQLSMAIKRAAARLKVVGNLKTRKRKKTV